MSHNQTLTIQKHHTQTDYVRALTAIIPMNGYGLPEGIYRPDYLPAFEDSFEEQEREKQLALEPISSNGVDFEVTESPTVNGMLSTLNCSHGMAVVGKYDEVAQKLGVPTEALEALENEIDAAYTVLDYSEGFPTFSGVPFWVQMPYEPSDAFLNFEAYLRQPKDMGGIRQLYSLETPSNASVATLQEQAALYYWSFRAKAFDTFSIIFRRKERERLALETENEHFLVANRLMDICSMYLDANQEELIETLSPKNFIELLKTATSLQRISIGLPANGPSPSSAGANGATNGEGSSLEVILRSLAQSNTAPKTDAANAGNANKPQDQLNAMRSLLHNPDVLNLAQELIVRVNAPSTPANFQN